MAKRRASKIANSTDAGAAAPQDAGEMCES